MWGGGHIWRAQHRDASHAKVTSQISVGSMPRPKFWVWKCGGGAQTYLCPPPLHSQKCVCVWGGGALAPPPAPRFLRQCYVLVHANEDGQILRDCQKSLLRPYRQKISPWKEPPGLCKHLMSCVDSSNFWFYHLHFADADDKILERFWY